MQKWHRTRSTTVLANLNQSRPSWQQRMHLPWLTYTERQLFFVFKTEHQCLKVIMQSSCFGVYWNMINHLLNIANTWSTYIILIIGKLELKLMCECKCSERIMHFQRSNFCSNTKYPCAWSCGTRFYFD